MFIATLSSLFDKQKDIFGVFITSTEITERKKLTEEVAIHSERLKTAQKIARLGYFEYDVNAKSFYCSEEFYEIFDLTQDIQTMDQLKNVQNMIHQDDRERVENEIKNSI